MNLVIIGLSIIAIAWLIQIFYLWKGKKEIKPMFVIVYMLGVLVLLVNEYQSNSPTIYYELSTLVLSGIVLIMIYFKKKSK
jgi:hypothetical protein